MVDVSKSSKYNLSTSEKSNWKKKVWQNRFTRFVIVLILVGIAILITSQVYLNIISQNYLGFHETNSTLGIYQQYAVSTDGAHCAKVGAKLLAMGGSAVDASIGTLLCMGVVLPNSMGIGGGCLMTIYNSTTGESLSIDGRETAPHYANENMFHGDGRASSRGPLSIGVPGELAAYWSAHQRFGKLKWAELFDQTIEMAVRGVPMVQHLSAAIHDRNHERYMSEDLREIFRNKTTRQYLNTGDILQMEKLAATLKRIRDNGVDEFYKGQTGQLFVEDLQRQGGKMTLDDLKNYKVTINKSLKFDIVENLTLYTQPLPGSGIILSVILRVMRNLGYYGRVNMSSHYVNSSLYYHHLMEAFKFAYSQRASLEDLPDDPKRLQRVMNKLTSEEYIDYIAKKIDAQTHEPDFYEADDQFQPDAGTAHVSVLDKYGLAVSTTTSINLYFGSGLISNSTGIIYNDIMDDFVSPNVTNKFGIPPSRYNRIRPGRRPISSMAPSIFVDGLGKVRLIIGASGGTHITSGIASVSLRHLYLGDDIKTAIDSRRLHHQFRPNEIIHEKDFPDVILESLKERGHSCKLLKGRPSIVMAIANQPGPDGHYQITANSDARKGGRVDGL